MLNDYFWFRFFRHRRRGTRRGAPVVLLLLIIAGLIYAAIFVAAGLHGVHRVHAH